MTEDKPVENLFVLEDHGKPVFRIQEGGIIQYMKDGALRTVKSDLELDEAMMVWIHWIDVQCAMSEETAM